MSENIIIFPQPKRIVQVMRMHRQYKDKPAYVTRDSELNRDLMWLEDNGWNVQPHPCGFISCSHSQVYSGGQISHVEAIKIQISIHNTQTQGE